MRSEEFNEIVDLIKRNGYDFDEFRAQIEFDLSNKLLQDTNNKINTFRDSFDAMNYAYNTLRSLSLSFLDWRMLSDDDFLFLLDDLSLTNSQLAEIFSITPKVVSDRSSKCSINKIQTNGVRIVAKNEIDSLVNKLIKMKNNKDKYKL